VIARWELLRYLTGHPAHEGFVLRLLDDEGQVGLGEARTIEGYGSGQAILNAFLSDHARMDGLLHSLQKDMAQSERVQPMPADARVPVEALFAAETALYDLASRRADQDLTSWLGYPHRESLANSMLVADEAQARRLAEAGNRNFKLKADGESADWLLLFHTLVEATDGQARIRVDANGSWNHGIALELLGQVPLENLDYLEQPFPVDDLASCRRLKDRLGIIIGIDEGVRSTQTIEDLARLGAADLVVIKPMFRGLAGALDLASTALALGLGVCVTHSMDGTLGRLAAMHVAAAVGGDRPHGLYAPGLPRLAREPVLKPDEIRMPDGPGLGWTDLRDEILKPWGPAA